MIKFKKGAFSAEKRIKPIYLKFDKEANISIAFDCVEQLPLVLLQLCWPGLHTVELTSMPDFEPNEYLFETHADKGSERWEIYAWALRDAMMTSGGFGACDIPLRIKRQYEWYMRRMPGATHPTELLKEFKSGALSSEKLLDGEKVDSGRALKEIDMEMGDLKAPLSPSTNSSAKV